MGIGAILGKTIENKIILMYMYAKRIELLPPECFLQGQTSSLHTWIHFQYLLGLKQVTSGHNVIVWSKISLIKELGGGGRGVHSGLNGLNFEKFFTDLEGWPLLVSLVDQRPVITKSNIVSKFPWYEIIIAIISTSIIIVNSMRPTMYLLTEWEGWTGKYLARGHGVRAEHSKVRTP